MVAGGRAACAAAVPAAAKATAPTRIWVSAFMVASPLAILENTLTIWTNRAATLGMSSGDVKRGHGFSERLVVYLQQVSECC
jgi:hypothetical protein